MEGREERLGRGDGEERNVGTATALVLVSGRSGFIRFSIHRI